MQQTIRQMKFNPNQAQAVSFRDGPCLVLAGPGSGKTAVITGRLLYLIEEYGIHPAHLLTLTFTKAAAIEMQSRFYRLSDSQYPEVSFGTFHSVFYQILRQARGENAPSIMKNRDQVRLTEQVLKEKNLKYSTESIRSLIRAFGEVKNGKTADTVGRVQAYADRMDELINRYDYLRKELNLIGFDDILPDCLELFRQEQQTLRYWQDKFRYIQTDEFQDVNDIQLEILQVLATPANNLFAVGDDDQAIYAFRGASPSSMSSFEQRFGNSTIIRLNTNYRSVPEIIRASVNVIVENKNRLDKESMPFRKSEQNSGSAVSLQFFEDEDDEKKVLLGELRSVLKEPGSENKEEQKSIALLTRTNHQISALACLLSENGIPFYMKETLTVLADHPQALDLAAYLRAGTGEVLRADFLRIMNRPVRYISRDALRAPVINRNVLRNFYAGTPYMLKNTEKLFRDLALIGRLSPARAIDFIRKGVGYERFLRAETDDTEYEKAKETLNLLQERAKSYTDTSEFLEALEEEKNRVSELAADSGRQENRHERIKLMTLHASKGLEFHTVFMPFLNEGILPQRHAATPEAREEERRLMYVGMTRARDRLVLSCVQDGRLRPSSFLAPLQKCAYCYYYSQKDIQNLPFMIE